MRLFFIGLLIITIFSNCNSNQDNQSISTDMIDSENPAQIQFAETEFDFGKITEGEKITHYYEFTNIGNSELVITTVKGSCGCTVPKNWPQGPVKPGDKGQIEVHFNSEGRLGVQLKTVTMIANTNPIETVLKLKGEVVGPDSN